MPGACFVVVFVLDIADDQFDDVLDRDDAVGAAIFVDHERQMNAGGLHLGQQVDRRHRRRHEQDRPHDLRFDQRHRQIDGGEIERAFDRLLLASRIGFRTPRSRARS